jgi:hypothetical protein
MKCHSGLHKNADPFPIVTMEKEVLVNIDLEKESVLQTRSFSGMTT